MLAPDYLDRLPEPVLELFRQVEEDILADMARRISKMGAVTETADWQRWRLEQMELTRSDITQRLGKLTGLTQQELRKLFQEAATQAIQADNEIYRAAGLSPGSPNDSPELLQLLNGGMQQTSGTLQNLTRTTANTATQQFERALDRAWLQISSGAFSYQSAIRTAIKSMAFTGMQSIQYPTGHTDTLEVAVRRAVLTGVGKTTGEICLAHAEEMGCDLMEITAHPGARPSHMVWQGKIVSLSGQKGYLSKSDIGYGTGDGFKGWNCRHDWFPFFEGLSESTYPREKLREYENQTVTYNGKTLSYYDATQQQRYIERQIRRWKREYQMMDAAGQDTTQASLKLAQWRVAEKDFCRQTGLDRDGFRSQVEGFGRSQASRATWETKRTEAIANKFFSFGNTDENVRAYLKDKAVIDMLSEHSIKYIQRISDKEIIVDAGKPVITGMRVHAAENLANKPDRVGMTQEQAQTFVDSAKLTLYQQDRKNLKFLAQNGYSILNLNHELVTAVPQKWRKKYDQYLEVIKS